MVNLRYSMLLVNAERELMGIVSVCATRSLGDDSDC